MSEYQYVAFRAVDRPLTEKELEYAKRQSSRAEITPWSFENEYNYSDFRGSADGMLRHGYDVYLHYSNFGMRIIALRLPAGLPFSKEIWSRYVSTDRITWKKDPKGSGGILKIEPFHEAGELDEIWDANEYVADVVDLRKQLLAGDLRALYVLWLCAVHDDYVDFEEAFEPPVPGGLADCPQSFGEVLDFFGVNPFILVAAAEGAPAAPAQQSQEDRLAIWIDSLGNQEAKELLRHLLGEDTATVKAKTPAAIGRAEPSDVWPTTVVKRSLASLIERAETILADREAEKQRKRVAKALRERQKRLAEMTKNPDKWLCETETLVETRRLDNYTAAADILKDLREAIGGPQGIKVTQRHAAHLMKKHPTLHKLKSSLRERGLLE